MTTRERSVGGATANAGDAARLHELRDLLQAVATGSGLYVALDRIARWVEQSSPGALCSVLLLDESGAHVRHGAAPSLPEPYSSAIDGLPIGPRAGSCGTAAYTGRPVIVEDIASDPLWEPFRDIALPYGLRACWSQPIIGTSEQVIGTFAVYRTVPVRPSASEWELVVDAAQLAALVIERARADTLRVQHEQTLASILQNVSDPIVRLTTDGRVSWANSAAERSLGMVDANASPRAARGELRSPLREPWDQARVVVVTTGREHRFEYSVTIDGNERWLDSTMAPEFDGAGAITSFVVVTRDLTERHRMEGELRLRDRRLQLILNTSAQSIAILDREGRLVDLGDRVEVATGISRARLLGTPFWETTPFIGLPEAQVVLRSAIERAVGGEARSGELTWRNAAGELRLGTYSVKPILGNDGAVSQLLLEGGDITEQRLLESRLRQSEKMESLGRLAGGIAHDFNNVLAAIHGYGELLELDVPAGSEGGDNLAQLLHATRRARDLVRQILAFSRKGDLEHAPLELRAVVTDAVRLLRAGLPSTVALWEKLPEHSLIVEGDAGQISQVLLNLGANAEYAMRGSRETTLQISLDRVTIETTQAPAVGVKPGEYARLVVADSGHGIAPEVLPKIFEPFFTTKPVGEGTGMGLAVVHGIVTAHGGVVRVDSRLGEGTRFELLLPVVTSAPSLEAPRPVAHHQGEGRVLFVDDEEPIVTMLRRSLPKRGYTVTGCTSPVEALALFTAAPTAFDIVITDRTMPGMTGEQLIARLQAIRPDLPIVLCSGQGHELADEFGGGGTIQQVSKPFEVAELLKAMERARWAVRGGGGA